MRLLHWLFKRKLRLLLFAVFLLLILVNAGAALHAWRLTRFTEYEHRPMPEQMSFGERVSFAVIGGASPKSRNNNIPDFPFREFYLASSEDHILQAWESTGQQGSTCTVILCHGHGANRSALLPEAQSLYNQGMRVVMFDFRAHGGSTGEICSIGYSEADDVKAAWDYVVSRYPTDSVLLYGVSMGAVSAARAVAVHDVTPALLVLDMPFNHLVDAVRSRVSAMGLPSEPAASLLTFWGGVHLGYWGFGHATEKYVKKVTCPVLLQWGTEDKRVGADEIKEIRNSIPDNQLTFTTYEGIGHSSLYKRSEKVWVGNILECLSQSQLPGTKAATPGP